MHPRWPALVLLGVIVLLQWPLWFGKGGWLRVWEVDRQLVAQRAVNQELDKHGESGSDTLMPTEERNK